MKMLGERKKKKFKKQHPFLFPLCKDTNSQPLTCVLDAVIYTGGGFGAAPTLVVNFYCPGCSDTLPEGFPVG